MFDAMSEIQEREASPLEQGILGSMLVCEDCKSLGMKRLRDTDFRHENNRHVFRAIRATKPSDALTITNHLKGLDVLEMVGGTFYVTQCMSMWQKGMTETEFGNVIDEFLNLPPKETQ